jgi:uncharacterized membrane protein
MRKWIPVALIAAALIASLAVYGALPDRIATHWGMSGEPDSYSNRFVGAFLMPGVMLALWGLLLWLAVRDPRAENIGKFRGSYDLTVVGLLAFLLLLHVTLLGNALGWPVSVPRVVPLGVGLLFLLIGNVMPRARPNFTFGIRTPWTLSDEVVWTQVHRVGGYLFCAEGLVFIASAFLAPRVAFPVAIGSLLLVSLGTVVYSYVLWARRRRMAGASPTGASPTGVSPTAPE